jgi:hypothetical protein
MGVFWNADERLNGRVLPEHKIGKSRAYSVRGDIERRR